MRLLSIRQIPMAIEMRTIQGHLQMRQPRPQLKISRQRNGLNIETHPAQVKISQERARASIGMKPISVAARENAAAGKDAAMEATARFADEGNMLADIHLGGTPLADIAFSRFPQNRETVLSFLPAVGPDIQWKDGYISINYVPDQLTFNWHVSTKAEMEYVPPRIEFFVKQWPKLVIEYLGGPLYFPPSKGMGEQNLEMVQPGNALDQLA